MSSTTRLIYSKYAGLRPVKKAVTESDRAVPRTRVRLSKNPREVSSRSTENASCESVPPEGVPARSVPQASVPELCIQTEIIEPESDPLEEPEAPFIEASNTSTSVQTERVRNASFQSMEGAPSIDHHFFMSYTDEDNSIELRVETPIIWDDYSTSSNTIESREEGISSMYSQTLISNMDQMDETPHVTSATDATPKSTTALSQSSPTSGESRPSKNSAKSRRKRGESLEREISDAILQSAAQDASASHFVDKGQSNVLSTSAEDILNDLTVTEPSTEKYHSTQLNESSFLSTGGSLYSNPIETGDSTDQGCNSHFGLLSETPEGGRITSSWCSADPILCGTQVISHFTPKRTVSLLDQLEDDDEGTAVEDQNPVLTTVSEQGKKEQDPCAAEDESVGSAAPPLRQATALDNVDSMSVCDEASPETQYYSNDLGDSNATNDKEEKPFHFGRDGTRDSEQGRKGVNYHRSLVDVEASVCSSELPSEATSSGVLDNIDSISVVDSLNPEAEYYSDDIDVWGDGNKLPTGSEPLEIPQKESQRSNSPPVTTCSTEEHAISETIYPDESGDAFDGLEDQKIIFDILHSASTSEPWVDFGTMPEAPLHDLQEVATLLPIIEETPKISTRMVSTSDDIVGQDRSGSGDQYLFETEAFDDSDDEWTTFEQSPFRDAAIAPSPALVNIEESNDEDFFSGDNLMSTSDVTAPFSPEKKSLPNSPTSVANVGDSRHSSKPLQSINIGHIYSNRLIEQ